MNISFTVNGVEHTFEDVFVTHIGHGRSAAAVTVEQGVGGALVLTMPNPAYRTAQVHAEQISITRNKIY